MALPSYRRGWCMVRATVCACCQPGHPKLVLTDQWGVCRRVDGMHTMFEPFSTPPCADKPAKLSK